MKRIFTLLVLAVMLPSVSMAQFDLSRALGALLGAMTQQTEKTEKAEKPAEAEKPQGETQQPQLQDLLQALQPQQPQQNPLELLAQSAPAARTLQGTWRYQDASAEYMGYNPLADIAIDRAEQFAKAKIEAHGITPGSFTITLRRNGTGTINYGERTLSGRYVYDEDSAEIIISGAINNVQVSVSGYVRYEGGKLDILVDADDARRAFLAVYPSLATDQTVQMVSGVMNSFPGIYGVATFTSM